MLRFPGIAVFDAKAGADGGATAVEGAAGRWTVPALGAGAPGVACGTTGAGVCSSTLAHPASASATKNETLRMLLIAYLPCD
jgi:hypothetical protein